MLQRNSLKRLLKESSQVKTKRTIEYLGCDGDFFVEHIKKKMIDGMTVDNIHIDHIKPVSRFNLDDHEEFLKCCHYSNLQPLFAQDNIKKNNLWTAKNEKFWNEHIIYNTYDKIYNE
jgi:hypothetical protein